MTDTGLNMADISAFFHSFSAIVFGAAVLLHVMTRTLPFGLHGRNGLLLGFYAITQGLALNCSMYLVYGVAIPHIELFRNILFVSSALLLLFFSMKIFRLSSLACLLSLSGFLMILLLFVLFSGYYSLYVSIIPTVLSFLVAGFAFWRLVKTEDRRWARNCLKIISVCFFFYAIPCSLITVLMEEGVKCFPDGRIFATALSFSGAFCVLLSALMIHQLSQISSNNWCSIIRESVFCLSVLFLLFSEILFFIHFGEKKAKEEARTQLMLNRQRIELAICRDINILTNFVQSKRLPPFLNPNLPPGIRKDMILRMREIMLLLQDYQLILLDADGRCILASDETLTGKDFSREKYIVSCKEKDASCFACFSEVTGLPGLYSSIRIYSEEKQIGYLVMRADIGALQKSLPGSEHMMTIVSGQRKIIFSHLPGAAGKTFLSASGKYLRIQETSPNGETYQTVLEYPQTKRKVGCFAIAQLHVPYLQPGTTLVMGTLTSYPPVLFLLGIHCALLTGLVLLLIWFFVRFRGTIQIRDTAWNELRRQFYADSAIPCLLLTRELVITGMNRKAKKVLNSEDAGETPVSLEQILPDHEMCDRIRRDIRTMNPCTYQILIRTGAGESYLAFGILNKPPKSPASRRNPPAMFSFLPFIPENGGISPFHSALFHAMETFSQDKIFALSPDGVFLSSNDPVISDRIKCGERIRIRDFFSPESASIFQTMLENVLTSHHSFLFEIDFPREKGGYRYMVNLFPVLTPDERNVWVLGGIAQDRSVQFKLEQTLRRKIAQETAQEKTAGNPL